MAVPICGAKSFESGKICRERPFEDRRRCNEHHGSACWCCGECDDPNGPGPAINTGFCAECTTAGCPEMDAGGPCVAIIEDCK